MKPKYIRAQAGAAFWMSFLIEKINTKWHCPRLHFNHIITLVSSTLSEWFIIKLSVKNGFGWCVYTSIFASPRSINCPAHKRQVVWPHCSQCDSWWWTAKVIPWVICFREQCAGVIRESILQPEGRRFDASDDRWVEMPWKETLTCCLWMTLNLSRLQCGVCSPAPTDGRGSRSCNCS